jgi:hypothetical protein
MAPSRRARTGGCPAGVTAAMDVRTALAAGRPGVSRPAGQEFARRELSKLIYHPPTPFIERLANAIDQFLSTAGSAMPGGWWTLVSLAALLMIVAWAVLSWTGPVRRSARLAAASLITGQPLTARDYREKAQRLAGAGQYSAAIIECMRAIAAELDEGGILPHLAGRTADELAAEAGRALPATASALTAAARLFDDVRYGDRAGTPAGYQMLHELDATIRKARSGGTIMRVPAAGTGAAR